MWKVVDPIHMDRGLPARLEEAKCVVDCIGNRIEMHPRGHRNHSRSAQSEVSLCRSFQLDRCIL